VILIVFLIPGGLCIGYIVIRLRRRPGKPVTWSEVFDTITRDEIANANELLSTFLLPDSIRPSDFLANYVEVSGSTPEKPLDANRKPTVSAANFAKGANVPLGYPRWFIAAYPDVVMWLSSQDETGILRISAEALYGVEGAKELIRIHGFKRIGELIEEKFEEFDQAQLRRLATGYCRDTRKRLECAMVVKEKKQPARRWFEAPPKRQRGSALSQRVLSDFD